MEGGESISVEVKSAFGRFHLNDLFYSLKNPDPDGEDFGGLLMCPRHR